MVDLTKGNNVSMETEKENNAMENNRPTFKGAENFCFNADGEINDLTREAKDKLIDKIIEVFDWCEIYPDMDRYSVGNMVDEWFYHKVGLLNLFVKSPFYNGEYAIEFDKPIKRGFDKEAYVDFIEEMKNWARNVKLKEVKIGGMTYAEIDRAIDRLSDTLYHLDQLKSLRYPIDTTEVSNEYRRFCDKRQAVIDGDYKISDMKAYLKSEWQEYLNFRSCLNVLSDSHKQFIDKSIEEFINEKYPKFKAKEGQKTSRVVNKLCGLMNLNNVTNGQLIDNCCMGYNINESREKNMYNPEFAKFADACNPFSVEKHVFISLNPIDYLTMSWGVDWGSCHDIDKEDKHCRSVGNYSGCYSSGTESYMLDESSVVFFILGSNAVEEARENKEPVPRKEMRQMFHIGKDKFIQSRLYPYDQTDKGNSAEPEDYVQYREIVQALLAELWGVPNFWTNKRGSSFCSAETISYGTHYRDYERYNNVNVSWLKEYTGTERITIGHSPICPCCGEQHDTQDNCVCPSCRQEGEYCQYHERYEDRDGYYIEGYGWVCDDALDESGDFARCDECGEWFYIDGDYCYSERDNRYFCSSHCAERADYYWNEMADDYLHLGDTSYSEIDNEDYPTFDMDRYGLCWAVYYIDDRGNTDTTIARKDDCVKIDNEWVWVDLCVEVDGAWYYEKDCEHSEIDGELLPTTCTNDIDEENDYPDFCWAYYDNSGAVTVARTESCAFVNGSWYARSLCRYIYAEDTFYLNSECVEVDGKWKHINMAEMLELDRVA